MHLILTRLSHFIEHKYFKLHYKKIGSGPKIIIAFHGFGQNASAYHCMVDQFNTYYTIYSIDLFFHGGTVWKKNDLFLDKQIWIEFFPLFLEKEGIQSCTLIGFSLGARLALASFYASPNQVTKIILLAPDGIRQNFWYSLAVRSHPGRALFKGLMRYPQPVRYLFETLKTFQLLDPASYRFLRRQMNSRKQTQRIYSTWLVFRDFRFDFKLFGQLLTKHQTQVIIFLGKQDPWFRERTLSPLRKHYPEARLIEIPEGHPRIPDGFCRFCRENPDFFHEI